MVSPSKFITIEGDTCGRGETVRVGVKPGWDGHEFALPLGKYSMAPTINADLVDVDYHGTRCDDDNTDAEPA